MNSALEILLSIILVAEPAALLALVLARTGTEDRSRSRSLRVMPSVLTIRTSEVWYLELTDLHTGSKFRKLFRGQLICGRRIGQEQSAEIGFGEMMHLSEDQTISRKQFRLMEVHGGIVLENLSGSNVTRINGYPVRGVVCRVIPGDNLTLGRSNYMITELKRCA